MSHENKNDDGAPLLSVTAASTQNPNDGGDLDVLVTVTPPTGKERSPVDVVCVVDTSISMSIEATVKAESGAEESHGLSQLDVVKHADRLALVSFDEKAKLHSDLRLMNGLGLSFLLKKLEKLQPEGRTNLCYLIMRSMNEYGRNFLLKKLERLQAEGDGLRLGLDTLRAKPKDPRGHTRKKVVCLLTDGEPTIQPPRGELAMLQRYRQKNPMNCTINTFGFGYRLESDLLDALSVEGDGSYAFIPDSNFVGTVFVHSVANALTTWSSSNTIEVKAKHGFQIESVAGGLPTKLNEEKTTATVRFGPVLLGQPRSLMVRIARSEGSGVEGVSEDGLSYCDAQLTFCDGSAKTNQSIVVSGVEQVGEEAATELNVARNRLSAVDVIKRALDQGIAAQWKAARDGVTSLVETIGESSAAKNDPKSITSDLRKDLEGQVLEALSKEEYFKKWGVHYLPSLARAHQLQQCNNFKDPGVQHYGGELFQEVRHAADEIFCSLPPPKPSAVYGQAPPPQLNDMSAYYNRSGGCFARGQVSMADGTTKDVSKLAKGDLVVTGADVQQNTESSVAEVLCVVETITTGNEEFVDMDGLMITPWHPVYANNSWSFPANLRTNASRRIDARSMFDYVLDRGHSLVINGNTCVTLGHGKSGDVVQHEYFGTEKVVDDLRTLRGWHKGHIRLLPGAFARDERSCLVTGLSSR